MVSLGEGAGAGRVKTHPARRRRRGRGRCHSRRPDREPAPWLLVVGDESGGRGTFFGSREQAGGDGGQAGQEPRLVPVRPWWLYTAPEVQQAQPPPTAIGHADSQQGGWENELPLLPARARPFNLHLDQDQHGTLAPSFGGGSGPEAPSLGPHRAAHACACRAKALVRREWARGKQEERNGHGKCGRSAVVVL